MRTRLAGSAVAVGLVATLAAGVAAVGSAAAPSTRQASATIAADEPPHPLRWLALGDSYSSGEGVDENYGHCAQSPGAYASEAFHRLEREGFPVGEQEFLACSGAQVPDVTESVDLVEQLEQATGRYDLITFTIGGNDAGFGDVLTRCLLGGGCAKEADLLPRVDAVRPRLVTIYGRIIDELLAPGGHIVVLGYPRIFEASSTWAWYIGDFCEVLFRRDTDLIRRLADRLNGLIADVTAGFDNVHFLDVADAFEGHNLCTDWGTSNEWINGISSGWGSNRWPWRHMHSFHPNRAGHAAEAAMLADYIKGLDWSELSSSTDRVFEWWMRIRWSPEEVAQGGPSDASNPLKSLYVGWINGAATIQGPGSVSGSAEADVTPNYPCSAGQVHVRADQNVALTGRVLPSSSSPLGPDLDLTISFGPATVDAWGDGCSSAEVDYFAGPLGEFLSGIDPVHVVVRARQTEDRYGARYDPVPVTIKGQRFVLYVE